MNSKEFRIGNLVKYDGRIFKIHTLSDVYPTLDTFEFGIGVVDWNNIKPIPLTEKWLKDFGFIKLAYDYYFWENSMWGLKQHKNNPSWFLFNCSQDLGSRRINDVHSLQNIYFALIGEELKMCECKEDKCALRLIFPNGNNATYACDDECYFTYCDKETKEWYIKTYPEEMKLCGCVNAT